MAEHCPDCGRPIADDACAGCHRSVRAPWPVTHVGLDIGKGNAGAARGSPNGRRYMISVRFSEGEAAAVKAAATERGHAVGRTVRDLVAEALSARAGRPPPRPVVDGPDDPLPDWGPVADPDCDCHQHAPVESRDSRVRQPEHEHVCALHGGSGRRCHRCAIIHKSATAHR